LIEKVSEKNIKISTCIFTTGITTIPIAVLFLCIQIFGFDSFILLTVIGTFCVSTTFLLINSAFQEVYKISTQKSVSVTPLLVLVSSCISFYTATLLM
jgi:hypothetical protein